MFSRRQQTYQNCVFNVCYGQYENKNIIQQEGYRLKSVRSYAVHAKDFLAISENFENFHVEFASQPRGGG